MERRGRSPHDRTTRPTTPPSNGCGWPPALEIPVGDWRSGYYSVTLTAGDERADAFLVVRPDPSDPAPILLVLSTTTWHAYNDWGGPSLYTGGTRVSFERPLAGGFLVKPEPIGRMMQPEPDREAMGFRTWAAPARPVGLVRRGRLVHVRADLHALGRGDRVPDRRGGLAGPRATPRDPRGLPAVPQRRPRRVLVVGHARRARRVRRARWQRRRSCRGTRASGRSGSTRTIVG